MRVTRRQFFLLSGTIALGIGGGSLSAAIRARVKTWAKSIGIQGVPQSGPLSFTERAMVASRLFKKGVLGDPQAAIRQCVSEDFRAGRTKSVAGWHVAWTDIEILRLSGGRDA